MIIEEYRDYCLRKKGVTESFPFPKNLSNVLVFKVGGKMFSATDVSTYASITVKCKPENIEELREKYPALQFPGYMNPKHWSRIEMDHSIPDALLYQWIDESYDLVCNKLTKKLRLELGH